eukprot:2567747-Alexandrium_andersonii.AAC.1
MAAEGNSLLNALCCMRCVPGARTARSARLRACASERRCATARVRTAWQYWRAANNLAPSTTCEVDMHTHMRNQLRDLEAVYERCAVDDCGTH